MNKRVIYIRPGGPKPTAEELETCEAVVVVSVVSEPFQRKKLMRKTTANPDRLIMRAQRHVQVLDSQLAALSRILKTLGSAISQGDICRITDAQREGIAKAKLAGKEIEVEDIRERLRWVEHEEASLCASLDSVIAQTSELMRQLDAASPPPGVSPPQDPSMEYPNPLPVS